MKASEIRKRFLDYFERYGHTIIESSSLVPSHDPTLLFTNAGMVQFKDVFLGKETRPYTRAVSSQKCVRAGGKHNDLENVGFTARHHTFFEMLGNFSFGDYFKKEAIKFAWEFTTKQLKLPKDKLYVTVFRDDDEAAKIWHEQEKVPKDRIFRMGEKDNFWQMGDTGPCGPCSELFIDRGEAYCQKSPPTKDCTVGCDCDRFMEFWNLVFMQYNRDERGELSALPKPSVDTGAGLERLAAILQGAETNYDTDLFLDIINRCAELCDQPYDRKSNLAVSYRVIADHARAATFLIGDGVIPANEGRGYVLRRIIRRAIRHGKRLGFEKPFLHKVCGFVIDQMKDAYGGLEEQRTLISKCVLSEEEQFYRTLEKGLALLEEETAKLKSGGKLPGSVAFKLYDTYGFPLDLTRVICRERDIGIDEVGFEKSMAKQRERSRQNWQGSGEEFVDQGYHEIFERLKSSNQLPVFVGYDCLECSGRSLVAVQKGNGVVEAVFDKTPFYGESGGQIGDRGKVFGEGFEADVIDVQRPLPDLIVAKLKVKVGELKEGQLYTQKVDPHLRALTARNHTATHLLHWALREVLGKHVKQAGSLVTPQMLRFDFTHFEAVTSEQLKQIEQLINQKIWNQDQVTKQTMEKEQALAAGAIAFFGEKYGEKVRVVSVGDFSVELCGGTHVNNASEINIFKIASEGGIAAGVRRIIAYTSQGAYEYLSERSDEARLVRQKLKANSTSEIETRLDKMVATEKELRRKIEKFESQSAGHAVEQMLSKAKQLDGVRLITEKCPTDPKGVKYLRELSERLCQKDPLVVAVLGMESKAVGKAFLLAAVGREVPKTVKANALIDELAPIIEGRGGGKPQLAQAGGTKLTAVSDALSKVESVVKHTLSGS